MKVKDVIKFLDGKYPIKKAEEWDAVGLVFGDKEKNVNKIIVALDFTTEVFNQAIQNNVEMIVTHHPFVFPVDYETKFEDAPYKKILIDRLENTGICLYVMHTNYDVADDGMSDGFIEKLGLKPKKIPGVKYARSFSTSKNFHQIKNLLLKKMNIHGFMTNIKEDNYSADKVAVHPGTGMPSEMIKSHNDGCGLIITADVKWSTWVMAKELGLKILQVPHEMEDSFTNHVGRKIKDKFPKLDILTSNTSETIING